MVDSALANVDRLVADAFEVRDESKSRGQKAQVVGDGLPQRKDAQDKRVSLQLVAVDLRVQSFDDSHDLGSPLAERLERKPDDSLATASHREQVRLKLAKLSLVVPAAVRCGRPRHALRLPQTAAYAMQTCDVASLAIRPSAFARYHWRPRGLRPAGSFEAWITCPSSPRAPSNARSFASRAPSTQPPAVPANQWATAAEACAASEASAACGTGNVCAPSLTGSFSVCVYQTGDVACPTAGYTTKQLIDTVMSDSRGCTPCTCGAPSTGDDGGLATCSGWIVTVSDRTSCPGPGSGTDLYTQTFFAPVSCYMNSVACDPGTTTYLNLYRAATATAGTCSPDGGVVTGSVTTSQVTVCCM
jgi:hypothetical protein